ncbi:uncharacterized protein CC84DRAFT_363880 [Paraphaeosphaeria sporulosa]|uniref:Uncharacterized protein n=1 Tax=Paraphaeosphaeria sporulosa TaxID=1460663 RepID=A0A177BYM0_9PLEO|nr:uncharacterized protein CC84DRAFT_363880 [Paraphaeosphaeria sporulosa]OAG00246.1 hypothetical protein CC84DRAFT_363880 [Paraphaeosphaeria sporulosa]
MRSTWRQLVGSFGFALDCGNGNGQLRVCKADSVGFGECGAVRGKGPVDDLVGAFAPLEVCAVGASGKAEISVSTLLYVFHGERCPYGELFDSLCSVVINTGCAKGCVLNVGQNYAVCLPLREIHVLDYAEMKGWLQPLVFWAHLHSRIAHGGVMHSLFSPRARNSRPMLVVRKVIVDRLLAPFCPCAAFCRDLQRAQSAQVLHLSSGPTVGGWWQTLTWSG